MADFTSYERNYPFTEEIAYNVITTDFENGAEQRRLKSENPKTIFTINFFPKTLTEATAIKAFFKARQGSYDTFTFTNPLDSVEYTVKFMDNSLKMERVAYNTVRMQVVLIEVL